MTKNLVCCARSTRNLVGRYKFNRLPFGIKVSQDIVQKKLDDANQDIENVCGIADDIIVAGETPQEHDNAMLKMLEASRKITSALIQKNYSSNSRKFISTATDCQEKEFSHPKTNSRQSKTSRRQQTQKNYSRF